MPKMEGFKGIAVPASLSGLAAALSQHKSFSSDLEPRIQTPPWVVKIEGITSSEIQGYEDYAPAILGPEKLSRSISHNVNGYLLANGPIRAEHVCFGLYVGVQTIDVINKAITGEKIEEIIFVNLATIQQNNVAVRTRTYRTCYLTNYEDQENFILFTFRYAESLFEIHEYDQEGNAVGSNASSFNFRTAAATSGAGGAGGEGEAGGGGGGESAAS